MTAKTIIAALENDGETPKPITGALEEAEGITDPFEQLIQDAAEDPGLPFAPDAVARLRELRAEDRAAFETVRARLKKAGCRVAELDDALGPQGDGDSGASSQAELLIELAGSADLFHTSDGIAYADILVAGHRETWPVRSKGFRRWLAQRFYEQFGSAAGSEAYQSALGVLEARAQFEGPTRPVFVRVGGLDGRLYLDLADAEWRAVEIDSRGWRIVYEPPIRFRRTASLKPLPQPERGGTTEALRSFLNVGSESEFVLVVAWMLAVLRDRGPYPILVVTGEQGSAKSSFCATIKDLLDPAKAPLRALPREDRDVFVAAGNGHVLAYDNVSGMPAWLSDTLCRLSTGAGFAVRQLYTDQDEALFEAARPVVLNGIEDIVTRPDLADRAIFLVLEPIPEDRRRPEAELRAAFDRERPRLLGVLLDAVVEGLARLPKTSLPRLPRMADFALWSTACETRLWPPGTFWAAYSGNREEAIDDIIDADPIASTVRSLITTQASWSGTATTLLDVLASLAGPRATSAKTWPQTGRALGGHLRRAATFLRKIGIDVTFHREGHSRNRIICIKTSPGTTVAPSDVESAEPASATSALSALTPKSSNVAPIPTAGMRTQNQRADAGGRRPPTVVRTDAAETGAADDADDADADGATEPAPARTRATTANFEVLASPREYRR